MRQERPVVCLLRQADPDDAYVRALEASGFQVFAVPVLRFVFVHEGALRDALKTPEDYAGLILTSPRAAEALRRARDAGADLGPWRSKPAYVVGPKTGAESAALDLHPEGAASGSAQALADVIVERSPPRPLLFLCGNRRRDDLPDRLGKADVPYCEIVVYETHPVTRIDFSSHPTPDWLVFYSPSGLEAVQHAKGLDWNRVRIAALGPTTAAALDAAGRTVDAVAQAPTPEALAAALRTASGQQG